MQKAAAYIHELATVVGQRIDPTVQLVVPRSRPFLPIPSRQILDGQAIDGEKGATYVYLASSLLHGSHGKDRHTPRTRVLPVTAIPDPWQGILKGAIRAWYLETVSNARHHDEAIRIPLPHCIAESPETWRAVAGNPAVVLSPQRDAHTSQGYAEGDDGYPAKGSATMHRSSPFSHRPSPCPAKQRNCQKRSLA